MAYIETKKVLGRIRNRPLKDYAGMRFGRLTALRLVSRDVKWNDHVWAFRCDCGNEKNLRIKSVRTGHTSSCGCLFSETMAARNETHGLSRTYKREYRSWKDMRARCRNPNDSDFSDYGGRGIAVCSRWDDFAAFFSDMGERPEGMTIDRVDVNGDYEPGNCRWATAKTQANNKRSNHIIEFDGESRTLQQWCADFGLEPSKVRWRLKQGWPLDQVFSREDHRRPEAR